MTARRDDDDDDFAGVVVVISISTCSRKGFSRFSLVCGHGDCMAQRRHRQQLAGSRVHALDLLVDGKDEDDAANGPTIGRRAPLVLYSVGRSVDGAINIKLCSFASP